MPTPIRQLNTQTHYLADGVTTAWPFSFTGGYISADHIRAQVRDLSGLLTELSVDPVADLIGEFQLRITPPVAAGFELRIYRSTPRDVPLVDFTDGSQLPEVNLDIVAKQSIFVAAESADLLGVSTTEDLTALATQASSSAAAATASQGAAAASAAAASASASTAGASATAAGVSATAASNSAVSAAASAAAVEARAISVKTLGAVGNGTTWDTAAFVAAIASLPGGGDIHVPRGWYRVAADALILHSGIRFVGEGCTNLTYGTPTNDERPSHIFLDSDTGALFKNAPGEQLESVQFKNISLGTRLFPNTTARGTTKCFDFSGSWPKDIKHVKFDGCQISNFGTAGIDINDPTAPSANPDWNVSPVTMTDTTFYYCGTCIRHNADNSDCWLISNTAFYLATGQVGIDLVRGGLITLISCLGGGGTMLKTTGSIRDGITFINCQYEAATAMLWVADSMASQQRYRPIRMISCTIEAPIILASPCHLISDGNRWVNNLEVTVAGVTIDSAFDSFLNSTAWNIAAGSSVKNFITNGEQLPVGVRGQILNGRHVGQGTAAPAAGTYVAGDVVWNSAPTAGDPERWICTAAGTPGTWAPAGQISYRSNAGTPVGAVVPKFVGEELLNTSSGNWWKSVGLTNASWVALN